MKKPAISVLTPTYNRAHVLHRVYDSLNRQKVRDFEWVIVDDGSTDDTPALVARWQKEADFPITCFRYSNNRGQIPAVNEGRNIVNGEYTLKLDSDDALVDDAMEIIAAWRAKTTVDTDTKICGLAFRCIDDFKITVGRLKDGHLKYPQELMIMSVKSARYELGIDFDIGVVYKTRIYCALSYGELDNSENLPPSIGISRTSNKYDLMYVDHPIRIYYRHDGTERLSDNHTDNIKWPRGRYLRALYILNDDVEYFWKRPKVFLNAARKITRLGLHIGRSPRLQFQDLAHGRARLLWTMGIPGGYFGYLRDRLRGRKAPKAALDITAWGPAAPPENPVLHPPPARFRQ